MLSQLEQAASANGVVVVIALVVGIALVIWGKRPRDVPAPPKTGGGGVPDEEVDKPQAE